MKNTTILLVLGLVLLLSGCAHVLSKEALQTVDTSVEYAQVKADPEAWRGTTLELGGRIIEVRVDRGGSTLEILRYTLDSSGYPVAADEAGGRFLARTDRFLDPEIYKADRMVALTGTVEGSETMPLQGIDYAYPVFRIGEIRLVKEYNYRNYPYFPYDYPYYYDPFYDPWYPWHRYPYWPYRPPFYGF